MIKLDPRKLAYDVKPEESAIFMDGSHLVGLAFQHFAADPRVLSWIDGVIRECTGVKKSIRVS
jgi:hypothetical protein